MSRKYSASEEYNSFSEFYPFYLQEHQNRVNKRLHFIGTTIVILIFLFAIFSGRYRFLFALPLVGYGFAWVGHFFFELNKPATFKYPRYSLMGDFRMWFDIATGKIAF